MKSKTLNRWRSIVLARASEKPWQQHDAINVRPSVLGSYIELRKDVCWKFSLSPNLVTTLGIAE